MAKKIITEQAKKLHEALLNEGIEAELEYWDGHKHIDICIPASKIYIEVDGMQHFTNPDQMARDFIRDHYSDDDGFNTLHIPNAVIETDLYRVVNAIKKVVSKMGTGQYDQLLKDYEKANNSHDWTQVEPFVHPDASYFFTDGTFIGIEAVKQAVTDTFAHIQDETYSVSDIEWVVSDEYVAVCRYSFHWKGIVDGNETEGSGRGTNVWKKTDGKWQIIHEHLSK